MGIFKDLFPLEDRWGKDGVFTPTNIVKDMIDLLPDSIWNPESTFIDISCKTGAFLAEIYTRLDTELSKLDEYKDLVKRRSHILNNQLFGLALRNDESLFFSRRNVFGDPFSDNIDVINAGNSSYLDLVKQKQYSIIETQLKGKFGRMKFDVVVGNPPYNNDIYLDFVTLGHRLSTQYTLMITPAKWQAKGGKKNEDFRANIVPYISDVGYFKNPEDVFPSAPMHGDSITYYLIDKTKHLDKKIKSDEEINTEINWTPEIGFNHNYISVMHKIMGAESGFKSIVNSTDTSITPAKSYFTSRNFGDVVEDTNSRYYMWSSARCIRVPEVVFKNTKDMEKYKVYCNHYITNSPVIHILNPNVAAVRESCLLGFGDKSKCESIKSYYTCKLIWYIVSGLCVGNASKEAFVNVPDPGKFDHIFTDEELYKKYSLTDDEIKVIESVIKERKQ